MKHSINKHQPLIIHHSSDSFLKQLFKFILLFLLGAIICYIVIYNNNKYNTSLTCLEYYLWTLKCSDT